jgi:hypothetical protein
VPFPRTPDTILFVSRMLQIRSSEDVSLSRLHQLAEGLAPHLEVVVDDQQMAYKSVEAPSWVIFLAEADWWAKALAAYGALYVAELTKEGAKATWRQISHLVSRNPATPFDRVAEELANLRRELPRRTRVKIGIPVPNDSFSTHLSITSQEPELASVEVALFLHYIPSILDLISENGLRERAATGIFLILEDSGDMTVSWFERDTLKQKTVRFTLIGG